MNTTSDLSQAKRSPIDAKNGCARGFIRALAIVCIIAIVSSTAQAQWTLGVSVVDRDPRPQSPGLLVSGVAPGGAAQRAGIEPRDVIYQVNGRNVTNIVDLRQALAASQGRAVLLIRDCRTGAMGNVQAFPQWVAQRAPQPAQPPADLAQQQVDIITRSLGMPRIPTYAAQVTNAEATRILQYGRPVLVIRYNPVFLNNLYRQSGMWASISVLAHEVGHHFNGDTGFYSGWSNQWGKELRADYLSGFVLARAGASLEESTRALRSMYSAMGSATHPDTPKRLAALAAGWQKGRLGR